MSKITLINDSCANQTVDVVVNAANSGLWAGGGICGVIFKKAGMRELTDACNRHQTPVKDGGAVITPAFNLKNAKAIIHAVGPDFGRTPSAFKELFEAYYNSLVVLKENGYHSISFPLISAGIFGGNLSNPVAESTKQCCRAYNKFVQDYPDYIIDVKLCAFSSNEMVEAAEYEFINNNEHLGKHVILLGLAGSYSYGTNIESSDIDIRGITLNQKSDLIGLTQFEQYVDDNTDTVIYAFNKIITLLLSCNPNTIELLGLNPEHYLYLNDIGQMLLNNKKLFLSRRAIQSFGGYADAQLRRLQNALARDTFSQSEKEQHIFNSVKNAMHGFNSSYKSFQNGSLEIFIDKAVNPELETEIFVNANLTHYPLRDYASMWNTMSNVVRDYEKIGKRNKKKDDLHLNKHAMHLIRLFMMALDILEKGEINTCRINEHDLLMDIRFGKYQKEDGTFKDSFYDMLADFEKRLHYASENTDLPEEPDMKRVQDLVMTINERVIRDEI